MNKCPFFGKCGGCKYDFAAADYKVTKAGALRAKTTDAPVWIAPGARRRLDLCFAGGAFGMFEARSKNIVPIRECPNATAAINNLVPKLAALPWAGAGSCLVTECENGMDVCVTSNVVYATPEFKAAAQQLPVMRVTWNGRAIVSHATPVVKFDDVTVPYPAGAFLQPSRDGADTLRRMVVDAAGGARRVADLFCGLGNFTYALNADGFDIVGIGVKRDLFQHPLTPGMLNQYDCVVMDPPRAGAMAQCQMLCKSTVGRVIYVSCNPATFARDALTLQRGGYKLIKSVPVDQFAGSAHWELFSVFEK